MFSISSEIYFEFHQKLESLQKHTSKNASIEAKIEFINIQLELFQCLNTFNDYESTLLLEKIKIISKTLFDS